MENHVRRMEALLTAGAAAAGVFGANAVVFDEHGSFFTIAGTGVEVALERSMNLERWRVREIYEVADLDQGGYKPVSDTLELFDAGDEVAAAKRALMRVLEARIDTALDETC